MKGWLTSPPGEKHGDNSVDSHDAVKATFVNWTATLVPFVLGLLLAISNGYFFAGFQDFNAADVSNLIAWGSGFAIEAATLAAVFNASLRLKAGDKRGFRNSLAVGLLLALISFTAQYVFLQMSLTNGSLQVNDTAIDKMPLFSMLVGVNGFQGHDVLFLIRASAYHIGEFACTFLFASKGLTHAKKLEVQRESFEHKMAEAQQNMVLAFMEAINTNMTSMMQSNQKLLAQQFSTVLDALPTPRVEVHTVPPIAAPRVEQHAVAPIEPPKSHPVPLEPHNPSLARDYDPGATAKLTTADIQAAIEENAAKNPAVLWKPVQQNRQPQGAESLTK